MLESIITAAIILGAAFFFFRWLRSMAKGTGGCSCGKCSKECPSRSSGNEG